MTRFRIALCASLGLALVSTQPPARAAEKAAPPPSAAEIEPAAMTALTRMSAYLGTLTAFEIKSQVSLELVLDDGQKLAVDGVNRYVVRRPDGFMIEIATDKKVRQLFYDGKSLTLSAPKLGYYATVSAPPTIRQTLDIAHDRYGIAVPLEDLFRWSDPSSPRSSLVKSAMVVGPATVDGVQCDQYAFREGDIDWQIWIERGDKPLPRKVVIVDRLDPAHPEFIAKLDWNTSPSLASDAFAFNPPKDAHAIRMAAQ